ncbi:hypothetical protein AAFN86_22470 [Roseomonas sp. CAU 1739]|uniref:hypothetical protein n=1 Tax=Roseomonas sp. CAU 1739 TaxID=3140364 RepID=UPI00325BDE39
MRRHLLVLTLLASLPIEAQADRAFCEGLQGLVNAAQSRFDWLPTTGRNIPGSIRERRGVEENSSGPHGVYYAVMYSHNGPSAEAQQHFTRLQREVGACLTEASFLGVNPGGGGSQARWQTQYAIVGLRVADGGGEVPESLVELSIASRW